MLVLSDKWQQICGEKITSAIRAIFLSSGQSIGYTEEDINAQSLRSGGGGGSPHVVGGTRYHPPGGELGGVTGCSANFTRRQIASPRAYRPRCLKMSPTCSFRQCTPETSSTWNSRDLNASSPRVFWRPDTGLVWSWRHKYGLLIPL